MKAIVRTQYGPPDVLQFTDVEKPTPQDNEVLIKLYAASVNPLELFNGLPQIFQAILLAPLLSGMGGKKTCFFIANINQKDLVSLKDLLEAGKLVPVIDRRYPLSDAAEALRYLEGRHAQGKIVLAVEHSGDI